MNAEIALTVVYGLGIVAFMFLPATNVAKKRHGFDEAGYCPLWRIIKTYVRW